MGIHDGHRQRLRNRFLTHSLDSLEDHEVLELLLFYTIPRQDTNPLAHALIRHFGSLAAVLDASMEELMQVDGIGEHTATLLHLCKPLSRRYLISRNDSNAKLDTVAKCAAYLHPYFYGKQEEHVYLLCLDARCRVLCCRELSSGTATYTELSIRKAAQTVLDCKASATVLAHNHPNGDTTPSEEDYRMTDLLKSTLRSLDVRLVDHIIFSDFNYNSLSQHGYFY